MNQGINAYSINNASTGDTNTEINNNLFSNIDFGPLKMYLDDDNITDISYSNNGQVWLKSLDKGVYRVDNPGINNDLMEKIAFQCANIMGKVFNMASPFLDSESAELRMNFVHDSIARNGIAAVFRKTPAKIRLQKDKIINDNYITLGIHDFLIKCVQGHCNIMVSGETGSGKTELVKYLASHTAENEKLITIEDTLELHLDRIYPNRDIVSMKTNNIASYSDVLVTCMRQNPKWILLSEVRSAEAVTAVRNSISSGHNVLSTIHADKAQSIPHRMYSLLESNIDVEQFMTTIYRYIQLGVHVRARYDKVTGKFLREVCEVSEFYVTEENKPEYNVIYKKNVDGTEIIKKPSKYLQEYLLNQGVVIDENDKIYKDAEKEINDALNGNTDAQEVQPVVETPVSQEVQPVVETPVAQDVKPVVETPVVQDVKPVVETPVAQEVQPIVETSVAQEVQPIVETPVSQEVQPIVETPVSQEVQPVVETPVAQDVQPVVETPIDVPVQEVSMDLPNIDFNNLFANQERTLSDQEDPFSATEELNSLVDDIRENNQNMQENTSSLEATTEFNMAIPPVTQEVPAEERNDNSGSFLDDLPVLENANQTVPTEGQTTNVTGTPASYTSVSPEVAAMDPNYGEKIGQFVEYEVTDNELQAFIDAMNSYTQPAPAQQPAPAANNNQALNYVNDINNTPRLDTPVISNLAQETNDMNYQNPINVVDNSKIQEFNYGGYQNIGDSFINQNVTPQNDSLESFAANNDLEKTQYLEPAFIPGDNNDSEIL